MFKPRKRRLYTPITPPSDEEIKTPPKLEIEEEIKQSKKVPEKT